MYHFLSGYTAKVAGTEKGHSNEPQATFSTYYGAPIMPRNPKEYCNRLAKETGVDIAVVDVNDLGKVKILASSNGTDDLLIYKALRANPAGNADEQTPIVIVRPS